MQSGMKKLVLNQETLKNLGAPQSEEEALLSLSRPPICEFTNTRFC